MLAVLRSSVCGSHSGDSAPDRNSVGRPPAVVSSRGGAPSVVVSVWKLLIIQQSQEKVWDN